MNKKINKYVNYLTENEPSAFCDYILCKEILELDAVTIKDSYDWAIKYDVYTELKDEQYEDGSWGGFASSITEMSKRRKYNITSVAVRRMVDLALDISDPMVLKTVELMYKYLSGELKIPDGFGKNNMVAPILIRREILQCISYFLPDDENVIKFKRELAENLRQSFANDDENFNPQVWGKLNINDMVGSFSYDNVYILYDCLDDITQERLMRYEWDKIHFGNVTPNEILTPDQPLFHFWLWIFEKLKYFPMFPRLMADKIEPYMFELCDRLIDEKDNIKIYPNKYNHIGRYSDSWKLLIYKKKDLLLRLIRILNKCE